MSNGYSSEFDAVAAELKQVGAEIDALLPVLVKSRRDYMRSRSPADQAENSRLEASAKALSSHHDSLFEQLKDLSGLPPEVLEAIDAPPRPDDGIDRRPRANLVRDQVDTTGIVDDFLANAIETARRVAPRNWLYEQTDCSHRIDDLQSGRECLSLVKACAPKASYRPCIGFGR